MSQLDLAINRLDAAMARLDAAVAESAARGEKDRELLQSELAILRQTYDLLQTEARIVADQLDDVIDRLGDVAQSKPSDSAEDTTMPTVTIPLNGRNYDIACGRARRSGCRKLPPACASGWRASPIPSASGRSISCSPSPSLLLADELEQREKELNTARGQLKEFGQAPRSRTSPTRWSAWPAGSRLLPPGSKPPKYTPGGCCRVRQVASIPGAINTSRELSLPRPWSRHMAPTCSAGLRGSCEPSAQCGAAHSTNSVLPGLFRLIDAMRRPKR